VAVTPEVVKLRFGFRRSGGAYNSRRTPAAFLRRCAWRTEAAPAGRGATGEGRTVDIPRAARH